MASDKWILRRPKSGGNAFQINSKSVYKKKSNASALMNFKKAVDNINELELKYIGYSTGYSITTVTAIVAGCVTAGAASAPALAALGLTGSALNCLIKLETQQKNALYYYFRV